MGDDKALETARALAGILVQENACATDLKCPSCGYTNTASDGDGLVYEGDYECWRCGAHYAVTNVVVRATVTWSGLHDRTRT